MQEAKKIELLKGTRVEFIDETHWPILEEFWKSRKYPHLFDQMLPDIGLMSYVDNEPISSCYFYTDGKSIMGFLAWICIKAGVKPKVKDQAFSQMMEYFDEVAKAKGVKCIYCQAHNASLMKRLQDSGYQSHDTDMVDMVKIIGG